VIGALTSPPATSLAPFADLKAAGNRRCTAGDRLQLLAVRLAAAWCRFLDLQAGQAQNVSTTISKEWLSTYTRLSSGPFGEGGDGSVPAYIQALLDRLRRTAWKNLQRLLGAARRAASPANATLAGLSDRLGAIGEPHDAGQAQMVPARRKPDRAEPLLSRLTTVAENSLGQDEVSRGHLAQHRSLHGGASPRTSPRAGAERPRAAHADPAPRPHDRGARRRRQPLIFSPAASARPHPWPSVPVARVAPASIYGRVSSTLWRSC